VTWLGAGSKKADELSSSVADIRPPRLGSVVASPAAATPAFGAGASLAGSSTAEYGAAYLKRIAQASEDTLYFLRHGTNGFIGGIS
jgi:hypothetical protein